MPKIDVADIRFTSDSRYKNVHNFVLIHLY